ncbi:MAG TPA: endonuclease MutS2 [Bacteroidota bacterium]|nr:endonuclease MutS2 [Bacteroidota bacterium]
MREFLSSLSKVEFDKVRLRIGGYLQTPMGNDHLVSLVPRTDEAWIRGEQALTTEMKRLLGEGTPVPIRGLPDLRTALQRASIVDFILPAADLLSIARLASNSRELKAFFSGRAEEYPGLAALMTPLTINKVLEYNILRAVDEEGRVMDGASQTLKSIRRSIRKKSEALRSQMESILGSLHKKGVTQEELITTRDGRLVIPVRAEFKHQVPGFIHSISASGATAFIEPTQTLEMNNDLRTLESQEHQEIETILRELTTQVRHSIPSLTGNISVIGRIDFLNAKAGYSVEIGGNEPRLNIERRLKLRSAIHPLLLSKHRRSEITPLDLEAGESFNTLIISGPNAGGKSVAMKTVGLLAAMAQSGCHIPASPDSEICVFSEIFVEMGDEQSIENDLSTFSSHLKNLKVIVENVTGKSLVLIDEIGNGTDPALGAALGIAVLERLSSNNALTIVTSHHSAFKTAGFDHEQMENAGMGFDSDTLLPNYRLSVGRPGNSYALEIAKNMHFPDDVLRRSFSLAGEDSVKLSEYLTRFEERTHRLEKTLSAAEEKERKASEIIHLYEEKLRGISQEVKSIRSRATTEANDLLDDVKRRIETLVREIRESSASRDVVRKAKEEISNFKKSHPLKEDMPELHAILKVEPGMLVKIRGTDMAGEVIELVDAKKVVLESAGKRVIVALDSLEITRENPLVLFKQNEFIDFSDVTNEIDLRGLYGDESIELLDQFIDKAVLLRLTRVRIIHGKGKGALRKRVNEYLSKNKNVASFQLGEWNEGGAGVTIAILNE